MVIVVSCVLSFLFRCGFVPGFVGGMANVAIVGVVGESSVVFAVAD